VPVARVPVAACEIAPQTIDFGGMYVGEERDTVLHLRNTSDVDILVTRLDPAYGRATRRRAIADHEASGLRLAMQVLGDKTVVSVVGPIHGFAYMVYLVLAFDLAMRARWPFKYTILVLLAGTVPFLSFVAERKVTHRVRAALAGDGPQAVSSAAR